ATDDRPTLIYVIRADLGTESRYKLGCSKEPIKRLLNLQTGSPVPLSLVDVFHSLDPYFIEAKLHARLGNFPVSGEWFSQDAFDALMPVFLGDMTIDQFAASKMYL